MTKRIYSNQPEFAPAKTNLYEFYIRHSETAPYTLSHKTLVLPLLRVTKYEGKLAACPFNMTVSDGLCTIVNGNWRIFFGR